METKHPMQPIDIFSNGIARFKENKIVSYLSEGRHNEIAAMDFSDEDRMQFAQLIGYSISGYGDLSYVTNESYDEAMYTLADKSISIALNNEILSCMIGDEL